MLTAAFVGWLVGVFAVGILGHGDPLPVFGITIRLLIGVAAAIGIGMLVSHLHAWHSISTLEELKSTPQTYRPT